MCSSTSVPLILLVLFSLCALSQSFSFLRPNTKIAEIRHRRYERLMDCFITHSKQYRDKRVYASSQANVAKLFDEHGNEIECPPRDTVEEVQVQESNEGRKYDQHCFFSPLNCFFTKLRLNKQMKRM